MDLFCKEDIWGLEKRKSKVTVGKNALSGPSRIEGADPSTGPPHFQTVLGLCAPLVFVFGQVGYNLADRAMRSLISRMLLI